MRTKAEIDARIQDLKNLLKTHKNDWSFKLGELRAKLEEWEWFFGKDQEEIEKRTILELFLNAIEEWIP